MMSDGRRSLLAVLVLAVALAGGKVHAAAANSDEQYPSNLEQKLGAGLVNTATGWMELVKSPVAITKKGGIGWGMTLGPVMGVVNTVGRTACGIFDLITFVLPTKPLVNPPMIWQDFYRETTYNEQFEVYDH
jgi:putative exosortase-associated protein (TIGR04073 family)